MDNKAMKDKARRLLCEDLRKAEERVRLVKDSIVFLDKADPSSYTDLTHCGRCVDMGGEEDFIGVDEGVHASQFTDAIENTDKMLRMLSEEDEE